MKSIPGFCNFVIHEANLLEFNKMNIYQILDPSLEPVKILDPATQSEASPQVNEKKVFD